jgi:TonB family protein
MSAYSLVAALSVFASIPLSAAVQDAKPLSQIAPAYAQDLRNSGVAGDVVVGFTISKTGEVLNPVVISSADRLLEEPTLAAVRKWKFAPAMNGDVPVAVKAVQTVAFSIAESPSGTASRLVVSNPRSAAQAKQSAASN